VKKMFITIALISTVFTFGLGISNNEDLKATEVAQVTTFSNDPGTGGAG
jgi:hypothetical protein